MARQGKKTNMLARNRRAFHNFDVLDQVECGIVLAGTEVCSLRESGCQLRDSFAIIRHGEVWLNGFHISPYSHGNINNVDSDRRRKLLLHKKQIRKLQQDVQERGLTLVPLEIYFNEKGVVKLQLGVCRGKKLYDKRADMAKRDARRDVERTLKERGQHATLY